MNIGETATMVVAIVMALRIAEKAFDALIARIKHSNGNPSPETRLGDAANKLNEVAAKLVRLCDLHGDLCDSLKRHDERMERWFAMLHAKLDRRT